MCGFALVLSGNQRTIAPDVLDRMSGLLAHRGPDDAGAFSENGVAMAFRRLAIFDLAPTGHQPMLSRDGRHVVVFNGAIYNFIELRAELKTLGHDFRSQSDTEVLLAAYQEWGPACLSRFNGMWAFVIYDRTTRRIFAARDRFGIKPMFWHHDARGLVLTSEIKAIRESGYTQLEPNWQTVASFLLAEQLDANDDTFYAGIGRVPAGCYLESNGCSPPVWRRYWRLEEAAAAYEDPTDPVEQFRSVFDDAVRLRMRSDVPVGVLLSGGLDSTSIMASMVAQRRSNGSQHAALGALCYRDPGYDETPLIEATLDETGAALWPLEADPIQFWDMLDRHLWHQDEPVHSFTSVVIFELMRLAREHGVKVVLNGQGADEVLAGYPNYFLTYWTNLVRSSHPWLAHKEIDAFARRHGQSSLMLHAAVVRACAKHLARLVPGYRRLAARQRRARVERDTWVSGDIKRYWQAPEEPEFRNLTESLRYSVERSALPLYLRVEDRNSMAHAVEVRLPFLDYRLVALAFRLASRWKLREEYTKVVLRLAMRGRLPEAVLTRVQKFGFPTSVEEWFRSSLYGRFRDLLASREVRESGVWNVREITRALEQHRRGAVNIGARLFDVAQFAAWRKFSKLQLLLLMFLPELA